MTGARPQWTLQSGAVLLTQLSDGDDINFGLNDQADGIIQVLSITSTYTSAILASSGNVRTASLYYPPEIEFSQCLFPFLQHPGMLTSQLLQSLVVTQTLQPPTSLPPSPCRKRSLHFQVLDSPGPMACQPMICTRSKFPTALPISVVTRSLALTGRLSCPMRHA